MFFLIMPCGGGGSVMENGQSAIMRQQSGNTE